MIHLQKEVLKKVEELTKYSKKTWNLDVQITISYNLDSANSVGQYTRSKKLISLNPKLLEEYGNLYILDVVVHEFAHAVVAQKYPSGYIGRKRIMPHGKQFKAVCSHFGNDGSATTKLFNNSTTMKKVKRQARIKYKCNCREHELSKVRHRRVLEGIKYTCTACGTHIVAA